MDDESDVATWSSHWEIGAHSIPKERYTSAAFAALENERLWPHVWQMACRLEEIPRPGDYAVYEIVDQSILVVRVGAETVRAFHNACPHRGTQLATGSGHFDSGSIACPFHGWSWRLDGTNAFVLDRGEIAGGCLAEGEPRLRECRVGTWLGCVFVNPVPHGPSLEEHVAPIRSFLDPLIVDQMRFYWHKSTRLAANWKVAQEAFFEGYHVPATHPQLGGKRAELDYETFENGHGAFYAARSGPQGVTPRRSPEDLEQLIDDLAVLEEGMDAMVLAEEVELARSLRGREIPQGSSASAEFVAALYDRARAQRRPMPAPDPAQLAKWGGECFVFPNYLVLPQFGNALIYRVRPDGTNPDACIFDVWSVKTYPEGQTPPAPRTEYVDSLDPVALRLIPRQDFANIPRIQRGLHSRAFDASLLSDRQEVTIVNMHRELDRYLKAPSRGGHGRSS